MKIPTKNLGHWIRALPQGEVVGIDGSKGMIAAAIEKKRPNLSFLLQDINHIEYENEFDFVFSNAALHWIKDHRKLLRNVLRALRVEGRIRFNFAADGNCSHFFKVTRNAIAQDRFKHYFEKFQWPWYMPSIQNYCTLGSGKRTARSRGVG